MMLTDDISSVTHPWPGLALILDVLPLGMPVAQYSPDANMTSLWEGPVFKSLQSYLSPLLGPLFVLSRLRASS